MNRWVEKAVLYTAAHAKVFGVTPNKHNVLFGLSVAQHETECGDALAGNWGGTTVGQVDAADLAELRAAALSPDDPGDLPKAQALLGDRPGMVLWRDTSAQSGWYWIWFYKPATPVDGAVYFIKVLLEQRPPCRAILDTQTGTLDALARAMYASHYFLGNFNPHAIVTYQGQSMAGDEANIESYRDALIAIEQVIVESLAGWTPSAILPAVNALEPPFDLYDIRGYQGALTWLALKFSHIDFNPKGVDGIDGKDTAAAIAAFQAYVHLPPNGVIDEATRRALLQAIEMVSPSPTEPAPPPSSA
jgi:hypothetical protein